MAFFFPTLYRKRITDITVEDLRSMGVKGIFLDIDNTLTTHDNPHIAPEVSAWLDGVQKAGFIPVVVSNNSLDRVKAFADSVGLPFVAKAGKPLPKGYREASAMIGLTEQECVAVGDQIFTDIVGANTGGFPSILLEPIALEVKQKFIRFKRIWERLLLGLPSEKRRKKADYDRCL